MSRWIGTRGGRRYQDVARVVGFLCLASLATPPVMSTGHEAAWPARQLLLVGTAPETRPAAFDPAPDPAGAARRETAVRAAVLRPHGPRAGALRHPAGSATPGMAAGQRYTLHLDGRAQALAAGARPGTSEGVSHSDGIRGPPAGAPAAPRESSLH